jgi:hypothetical protein
VNVSAVVRAALREHLNELIDEEEVAAYRAAFAESAETDAMWDRTAGELGRHVGHLGRDDLAAVDAALRHHLAL